MLATEQLCRLALCLAVAVMGCNDASVSTDTRANADAVDGELDVETSETWSADDIAPDAPPMDVGSTAVLLKGPYLQEPLVGSIRVVWETDEPAATVVEVTDSAGTATFHWGEWQAVDTGPLLPELEGVVHQVLVEGLVASEAYSYRVLSVTEPRGAGFAAAPPVGTPFSFVAFGDTRTHHEDHALVVDHILAETFEIVIHTGDMVGNGVVPDLWQVFFDIEAQLMERAVLFPVFGNHELGSDPYFGGLFVLPDDAGTERYYTFVYGNARFVVLDSNYYEFEGEQLEWFLSVLDEQQASGPDFLFVALHHPLYTFGNHRPKLKYREVLQPLFEQHGVDAVFTGHNHCYEHFIVNGIHYIVSGGGGAPLYSPDDHVIPEEEHLRVSAAKIFHYLHIETHQTEAQVVVHDVSNEQILETFVVYP